MYKLKLIVPLKYPYANFTFSVQFKCRRCTFGGSTDGAVDKRSPPVSVTRV